MEKNTDENIQQVYASSMNHFAVNGKKSVFLFMPNLTSYAAIMPSSADDFDKSELLKNVELGFFAKHGFKVFPNSYLKNNMQNDNLVELLNILDNEEFEKAYSPIFVVFCGIVNCFISFPSGNNVKTCFLVNKIPSIVS